MGETAVRTSAAPAETAPSRGAAVSALRGAAITFLVAFALFGPLVGLRIEGKLKLSSHMGLALALTGAVTAVRFLFDILVWRPLDGGHTFEFLGRAWRSGKFLALAAVIVVGLTLFAWGGIRTAIIDGANGYHWLAGTVADLVTFSCIAAFAIVSAMAMLRLLRLFLALLSRNRVSKFPEVIVDKIASDFPGALLAVAFLFPFLFAFGALQRSAVGIATQILIYIMLGWGLNIVVGLAGLLDLGYVAFFAVGAYSYAIIAEFGWSFWVCLPVAGLLAALWGLTLGFPVLRLRGDYLAIVTLAFGEIIRVTLINWQSVTGGPNGINRIPRPSFFGLSFEKSAAAEHSFHSFFGLGYDPAYRLIFLYYLILLLALATNFFTLRLKRLPMGRAWEALREDEIACRSLGINTVTTKLSAFALGAMFGGFAGAFFSARQGHISPESFVFDESARVLAIVVLGGLGRQLGVVIAAVVLVGCLERFRELQEYRMLIFGLTMVLVMNWRPRGLLAGRTPSISLLEARAISAVHVKEGRG